MKRNIQASAILLLMGTLLYSCDTTNPPFTEQNVRSHEITSFQLETDITFELKTSDNTKGAEVLVSRVFDDGITTFTYTVTNTPFTGNPTLTNFTLNLPSCAGELESYTPNDDALYEYDEDESENKILWNTVIQPPASEPNNKEIYSISYSGDVKSGMIDVNIQQGGEGALFFGLIPGPGCDSSVENITISGVLFIDANENGSKDPEEAGLEGVQVIISSSDGTFNAFTTTLDLGTYSFEVPEGGYTITVPEELVDFKYYKIFNYAVSAERPSSTTYVIADTDTDQENINFGYVLDTEELTSDLLDGTVLTNTKSSQYWAFQVRHAAINRAQVERNPNVHFTKAELIEILEEIEEFYLEIPFQFSNNGELKLQEALSILTSPFNNDYDELLQQLLTAQFNVLSKERGALIEYNETGEPILNDPFNTAILIFGEAVACNAMGACPGGAESSVAKSKVISATTSFSSATISDGTRVLSAFNGTGGIGSR